MSPSVRICCGWRQTLRQSMRRIREFLAMGPEERSLFVRAAWRLPLVALQLRLFGLRPFQQAGQPIRTGSRPPPLPETVAVRTQRTRRFVELAARYGVCRGNCLSKSLTLRWLLQQQGIETELRIGVRTSPGGLEAHAWIEYQGAVLNDRQDVNRQFTPFERPLLSRRMRFGSEDQP